jgi:hypothetical protein
MAHGFARFRCRGCAHEVLVAFSCKGRGFGPSCCGRRMAELAAHLADGVLGGLPVRQWVLTLPHRLRYALAWDHRLCRAVLAVFVRAVLGFERRRARLRGMPGGAGGAVTAIPARDYSGNHGAPGSSTPNPVLVLGGAAAADVRDRRARLSGVWRSLAAARHHRPPAGDHQDPASPRPARRGSQARSRSPTRLVSAGPPAALRVAVVPQGGRAALVATSRCREPGFR